jgi:hypothetical protein
MVAVGATDSAVQCRATHADKVPEEGDIPKTAADQCDEVSNVTSPRWAQASCKTIGASRAANGVAADDGS